MYRQTDANGIYLRERVKIGLLDIIGIFTEEISKHPFEDKRLCLNFRINPEIIAVAKFLGRIGERRVKVSQQPMDGIHRNLPNTEESENMVNTIRIEIFSHLAEPLFPPAETVERHLIPVVCGEAPVLSEY